MKQRCSSNFCFSDENILRKVLRYLTALKIKKESLWLWRFMWLLDSFFVTVHTTRFAMHRNRIKMRLRAEKLGISAQNVREHLAEQWRVNSNLSLRETRGIAIKLVAGTQEIW